MPWGRLDDQANGNAKLLALSDGAWRMWGCGLIYCQANLTDGFIPEHAIQAFGVRAKNKGVVVRELCSSLVPGKQSLWVTVSGGYQVHDYLQWNDSREEVLKDRALSRARQERWRNNQRGYSGDGVDNALGGAFVGASSTDVHVPQPQEPLRDARGKRPNRSVGLLRPNGNVAFDGPRICVPWAVHHKLLRLRNGNDAELQAFYARTSDEWTTGGRHRDEPGADMFAFWTARYNEHWPPTKTAPAQSSGPSVAGVEETRRKFLQQRPA